MAAPQSNNKFSSSEFAKCMSVFVGGLGATAIAIGKTGELASRAATGTPVRLHPTIYTYPLPRMVLPTTGLVASCVFTSCCAAAAVMTYIQGVYGPSHFEQPRTLTKEWTDANKVYRELSGIHGAYGSLGHAHDKIPHLMNDNATAACEAAEDGMLYFDDHFDRYTPY